MATRKSTDRKTLLADLKSSRGLRQQVIKMLARDYPREFLAPVKLKSQTVGKRLVSEPSSCKEWQE